MELNVEQVIQLFLNLGAVAAFAILFWLRIVKQTDIFIEKMEKMEQQHREALTTREDKHDQERNQREQELKLLTEKAIETMTKLEMILVNLNHEQQS